MLAWKTTAQDIEEKTQRYWRLSSIWNNRVSDLMAVGEAIKLCTDNLKYTNPERQIVRSTNVLLGELIQGEGSPLPPITSLIAFPDTLSCLAVQEL